MRSGRSRPGIAAIAMRGAGCSLPLGAGPAPFSCPGSASTRLGLCRAVRRRTGTDLLLYPSAQSCPGTIPFKIRRGFLLSLRAQAVREKIPSESSAGSPFQAMPGLPEILARYRCKVWERGRGDRRSRRVARLPCKAESVQLGGSTVQGHCGHRATLTRDLRSLGPSPHGLAYSHISV